MLYQAHGTRSMDTVTNHYAPSPSVSLHSSGPESEFNKCTMSAKASCSGDTLWDSESTGEIITRFELDIACICEKLTNLNLLLMRMETKENDFETLVSDMDSDLVVNLLELDFLSGLLDSEVRVLETHISYLQNDKANVREYLSSKKHLGEPLVAMEDMLHDSEESLKQSLEQIFDIKVRAAKFQRILSRFSGDGPWKDNGCSDCKLLDLESMKMQTVEHQRHVLRMLEKSLVRELDLEKRVSESSQIEEALTMRLRLSEQEVLAAEEETEMTLEKFYEADHTSAVLMETSKELLSKIKMSLFNLRGFIQQEANLKTALVKLEERIRESELQLVSDKASMERIVEMENTIKDLRQQITDTESRAVKAEAKCHILTKTSQELKDTYEKVVLLEKELSDTLVKLQHAEACYEASEEEKSMLHSTINDMGNVIDELKKKVSRAEIQTENVEDKCILLSETNADLKKELSFARGRVKYLEASLHQTEETKKATAKDISLRTKLITDLVVQMALERERLQKQITSLKQENRILVKQLNKTDKSPSVKVNHGDEAHSTITGTENKQSSSTCFKAEKNAETESEPETERNIDIWELERSYIVLAVIILVISLVVVLINQTQVL